MGFESSMKVTTEQTKRHHLKVDKMIEGWLQERQSLILLLCAVDGLPAFTPETTRMEVKMQAFCVILMDYVSAGHFEIYENLIQEAQEFGNNQLVLIKELYPKIHYSTELALLFNDKYDCAESCQENTADISKDLSRLAEALEERFRYEDTLIHELHTSHQDQVA